MRGSKFTKPQEKINQLIYMDDIKVFAEKEKKDKRLGWLVGWLVGVYGISTIVGYLMPNPLYTSLLNIIYKHILLVIFLNEPKPTFCKRIVSSISIKYEKLHLLFIIFALS